MAAAGGKLLIMNHEMSSPKCDKVYEFDPAAGVVREILSIPDDGSFFLKSASRTKGGIWQIRMASAEGGEKLYLWKTE